MEEEPDGTLEIRMAVPADIKYIYPILEEMDSSARARGTGIGKRTPQSLCRKIYEGKAVIAIARKRMTVGGTKPMTERMEGEDGYVIEGGQEEGGQEEWAGFSYIESWGNGEFVSNSGLIVNPIYRHAGVAKAIKTVIFELSRKRYPGANIFSITTGAAVMKLNHQFGFRPVTYSEITQDATFWDQCRHCVNYSILESNHRKMCLCTAMLFTPEKAATSAV